MFKTTTMKKVRTKKDLLSHPLVDGFSREHNPGVFDDYEYTYWLYLKPNYWFKELQQGLLHEPTIARLCDEFNSMTISKRTDGF
jgi:hypothetical protein